MDKTSPEPTETIHQGQTESSVRIWLDLEPISIGAEHSIRLEDCLEVSLAICMNATGNKRDGCRVRRGQKYPGRVL